MDGIETVQRIRELGGKWAELTIIALTANAIEGVREMFLENGFEDFVSKPIDADKLAEVVSKHLPPEKVSVKEVEEAKEVADNKINTELLAFFCKKLPSEREKLAKFVQDTDLKMFGITVHAMKSSLATVGESELSQKAAKLETAAKSDDADYCKSAFPEFAEALAALQERLSADFPLEGSESDESEAKPKGEPAFLTEKLSKAAEAAEDFESELGSAILAELLAFDFGDEVNGKLKDAKSAFDDFNCTDAAERLGEVG
jgi:CheY-like chemotaxis protein